jgi:hypothetical protein
MRLPYLGIGSGGYPRSFPHQNIFVDMLMKIYENVEYENDDYGKT